MLGENHAREQALHDHVAEFLRDVERVAARDGVGHLIRFFDQMSGSVGEFLFAIPGASLAQFRDDREQFRERLRRIGSSLMAGDPSMLCFAIWMEQGAGR